MPWGRGAPTTAAGTAALLRLDLERDSGVAGAASAGGAQHVARGIDCHAGVRAASVFAGSKAVQNVLSPTSVGIGREFEDRAAADDATSVVEPSIGRGAVEIPGAVERQPGMGIGTVTVDSGEVVEDRLRIRSRRRSQLVDETALAEAAEVGHTIEVAGSIESHTSFWIVSGVLRVEGVQNGFGPSRARRRQTIDRRITVGGIGVS